MKANSLPRFPSFLLRYGNNRRTQTILDQLIVSGSNFLTGVLLVRGLGLVDFGRFTIAYTLLLLANNIQLSFISSPMLSLGALCGTKEETRRYVRGMFGVQLAFAAVAMVLAVVSAAIFLLLRPQYGDWNSILAFAASIVMYLLQDWLRRYYFVIGKAAASIWNDAISYLGQLVVLAGLFFTHRLTVNTALWAIAVTSGAAFGFGAVLERLGWEGTWVRQAWQRSRGFSRDLAIASQLQWFVYQGAMLVGAGVLGAQAAGGVRATQNVVGPVNIAFQAMENLVPLRAGEEMRRNGIAGVSRFLFRFGRTGFFLLLGVFAILALFSRDFLAFFYGRQVAVYAGILNLQMLYFLLAWPIRQFTYLFRTVTATPAILWASLVAAVASMAVIYPCVHGFGALGIMLAAVAGQIANLLYLTFAWVRLLPQLRSEQAARRSPPRTSPPSGMNTSLVRKLRSVKTHRWPFLALHGLHGSTCSTRCQVSVRPKSGIPT